MEIVATKQTHHACETNQDHKQTYNTLVHPVEEK